MWDLLRNPDARGEGDDGKPDWGTSVKIPSLNVRRTVDGEMSTGAIEVTVTNASELRDLIRRGTEIRSTFATDLNLHSSRSHSLVTVRCRVRNGVAGVETVGKLHLVDLAGSERCKRSGVEGVRLVEVS